MDLINKYTVLPTSTFKEELKNITDYIKINLNEPIIAEKLYNNILKKISSLSFMPERYSKLQSSKFINRTVRKVPIGKYLLIYEINKDRRTSIYFTYFSFNSKLFKNVIIKINFFKFKIQNQ